MTDQPSEADVEALAEQIDAAPWSVNGYTFEGGSDDSFTVTLEAEWVGAGVDIIETGQRETERDRSKTVKVVIDELEDDHDGGAPIETVLDRAEELGMERSLVEAEIGRLRRQGDVYEPTDDHLRTV